MKKIFKIALIVIAGTIFNSCQAQIANFQGKWKISSTDTDEFILTLNQNNSVLTGSHISVQLNGDKIDSTLDTTDISINGNVSSNTQVLVTFTSAFSNTSGKATLTKISPTEIAWKIVTPPSGEYYFPKEVRLYKE
ncbi:hypothetical protein [Flavobacterium piscis]|uniref:Lipocalin-like domain-containing protein n=1 Tax=Flavobacterium piscis TaxID=1114874 RepID=A0ABU1YC88_9FLAO|nr:hypothetical protein [Flavobacterium piscis]MDR7211866.1 hypothetical protein [Flavobacterium piscis]